MASGLPSLVIGVGGTGLKVLQRVKERLQETYYGEVPSQITLLEFDTALQSPADNFCGVQLTQESNLTTYGNSAMQEMQLIQTNTTFTMDHAMAEGRNGVKRWDWMEINKLDRLLQPQLRVILDGAGAFRPVGRTAFYLNYQSVEAKLREAMQQVLYKQPVMDTSTVTALEGLNNPETANSRRNVFLVGSLAGGTGSGGFLDLAALMHQIKTFDQSFNNIALIGVVVLPRFFANIADELGRRVPNTYAGLRELDRLMRAHKNNTPYRFTGGHNQPVEISDTLFDLCYLVDIEDYGGRPAGTRPDLGALPAIADMIVAHTDLRLGLRLNAANINVAANYALPRDIGGNGYAYQARRFYSALNNHTVIFPREDVAKSLSLRLLLDLIDEHLIARDGRGNLLVPTDPLRVDDLLSILSKDNPTAQERISTALDTSDGNIDLGLFVRRMLQNRSRRFDTTPDNVMGWLVEDSQKRKGVLDLIKRSLDETTRAPADPNNMGNYITKVWNWQEKYLGPLQDPNNPLGDRKGGEWEEALGSLVTEQRIQMESYVQVLVLRLLNQRHEQVVGGQKTSLLRPNRLGYTLTVLRMLKDWVREFIRQAELSFGETSRNLLQLRRDLEEHRAKVANFRGPIVPVLSPNPGPDYLRKLREVGETERQRLLRNLTVTMAQQFGGDIAEEGRSQSVLDSAIQELEDWVKTLDRVRELVAQERGRHEARRKEKYAIGVRSYITDPARFQRAASVETGLYERYKPIIWRTLLGPDPMGGSGAGLFWEPAQGGTTYFDYQITTKEKQFRLNPRSNDVVVAGMLGTASGVEAIAREWQTGAFRLVAEQVRGDKRARVAAYIPDLYQNQVDFKNRVLDPNSRALVQFDALQPNQRQEEHYLAVDPTSDEDQVNSFFSWFQQQWNSMNNIYLQAESDVACTFLSLYHGLELDHFKGFNDSEKAYRAMEQREGCLHLFPEERLAADYEARIPNFRRNDWAGVRRLHPEVVAGLRDTQRVRGFAQAVVSGLLADEATDDARECFLKLPGHQPMRLTDTLRIDNYQLMGRTDRAAARLLQAFHTYTLLGRPINDQNSYQQIDYATVSEQFRAWFSQHHGDKRGEALSQLLRAWETDQSGPSLYPLFNSESRDPRFLHLGVVLMLELIAWSER
jgi:hypothetical protein